MREKWDGREKIERQKEPGGQKALEPGSGTEPQPAVVVACPDQGNLETGDNHHAWL